MKIPSVPNLEVCKETLSFIDNESLRYNLALKVQYVAYIDGLEYHNVFSVDSLEYSLCTDHIIHLASIVEGVLFYVLSSYVEHGGIRITDLKEKHVKQSKQPKKLYDLDDETKIVCYKESKEAHISPAQGFRSFNAIAKNQGIWNEDLFQQAEDIREKRNMIHIPQETDFPFYTREDMETAYASTNTLLQRLQDCIADGFDTPPPGAI